MKAGLLHSLQALRAQKRPCALVTHLATGASVLVDETAQTGALRLSGEQLAAVRARMKVDQSGLIDDGLFVRVYVPPLRLIVVGAVHIARVLAPMAALAGFDVIVVDPREGFARSEAMAGARIVVAWPDEAMTGLAPDERTAVVTLTHDPKLDDPALTLALRSNAFYIGALGSRKTHAKRMERLKETGFMEADLARIHGPVGLDINALTPAEIAVSIVAQIVATLRTEAA